MARSRSTLEAFKQAASHLLWSICLALAAGSAAVLHVLAIYLSIPMGSPESVSAVQSPGSLGALFVRTFYGTLATFFQFIIPAGLLFAALASFLKRSQARALLAQAQSAPESAISSMTWARFERLIGESFRRPQIVPRPVQALAHPPGRCINNSVPHRPIVQSVLPKPPRRRASADHC